MSEFIIKAGEAVLFEGKAYQIKAPLNLETVILSEMDASRSVVAKITDLVPITCNENEKNETFFCDVNLFSSQEWAEMKRREAIIQPLANQPVCSLKEATLAATQLGISWRQIYNLIQRYKKSNGQIRSLSYKRYRGGKGKSRISPELDKIIQTTIEELYLTRQQNKASKVVEEVFRKCHRASIIAPSERTIRRRIDQLNSKSTLSKRRGTKEAFKKFSSLGGSFPQVKYPLSTLQIDHTPVDLIIVDEDYRQPIGRPYLTVAIDVFSRCITGFFLSLDSPSSTSVALCLLHSIFDKDLWLAERAIEGSWPIWGKPDCIYVDNAAEFHSEAMQRGCEAHGIKLEYRPIGKPHYGGIVERLIGTLMKLIHELPGTTFSNINERGEYQSEKKAVLTFSELEKWLTIVIVNYYHQKVHAGIKLPPIEKYSLGIFGDSEHAGRGYPVKANNKKEFLIDFLPIERRSLQRNGFVLDHIVYYSNALSPFIANRNKYKKFIIRRDLRNLSCIYVLDPNSNFYFEVPCRTLSRPTVTLWEHRQAEKYLREQGVKKKDETLIFRAIEHLREITEVARAKTKVARHRHERLGQVKKGAAKSDNRGESFVEENIKDPEQEKKLIERFEDIELW